MPLFSKRELEILEAVSEFDGNIERARKSLGISASAVNSTLTRIWKKIKNAEDVKKRYRKVLAHRIKLSRRRSRK